VRRLLAVPLLVAAAVAGCGGGEEDKPETPKPAENIQAFEARLKTTVAAIQQGRCQVVQQFNLKAGYPLPCEPRAKKLYEGFKVMGSKTYGSGGVVEFQDSETKGRIGVYTVAVGEDGKYQITGPIVPILDKSTLATEPQNADEMDDAAEAMVDAIRTNNCDKFIENVVVPPGLQKPQACKQELVEAYGPLRQQLVADKDAKPERLDGNDWFMFYALESGGQYRTLVVARAAQGSSKPFLGFVTLRGPEEKKKPAT
jgi:hypothetical protein